MAGFSASAIPAGRPAPRSATEPTILVRLERPEFVDEEGLDKDRALGNQTRSKTRSNDQRIEQIEVGVGRNQQVDEPVAGQPLACLTKEWSDVAVVRAGMPRAVGHIARLARERRRARYYHVEQRSGGKPSKKVRAYGRKTVSKTVCRCIFRRRQCGSRVYVDGGHARGAGPGRGESKDPGPGPDICHP